MSFLSLLPHQIPFRALSAIDSIDASRAQGVYFCSGTDEISGGNPPFMMMIFEAMAQLGGSVAFAGSHEPAWLSGISDAALAAPVLPGDRILLRVELQGQFGAMYRFEGTGFRDDQEIARAKFYLVAQTADQP